MPIRSPHLESNETVNYYWSKRFDPEFYIAQARAGFIAITHQEGSQIYLLPELQFAYAVLHWEDLKIDRSVERIMSSGRMEEEQIQLRLNRNPGPVLKGLNGSWSDNSWLRPPYVNMIQALADYGSEDFQIWGVELWCGSELAAGELGYTIGRTYTSLSGFMNRGRREWNHFGKLQMVLLIQELQRRGYAFHNLGHPYMEYKIRLGAQVMPRSQFLRIWDEAIREKL